MLLCEFRLCMTKAVGQAHTPFFKEKINLKQVRKEINNLDKMQTKNVIISFRVTPEEKARLERKSRGYDRLSDYLRDCVLGKEIVIVEGADRIADELRRIGNNLNQLTRAVHMGQIQTIDLSGMRKEVALLWQSLNSLPRAVR